MTKQTTSSSQLGGFITGALLGGVVGSAIMLLAAPQSGKRTRTQLQKAGLEVQARVTDRVDEARLWAESTWWDTLLKVQHLKRELISKLQELQYHSQTLLEEQMGHVADLVEGRKTKEKAA